MIKEIIDLLSIPQMIVFGYIIVYGLYHGIWYHMIVFRSLFTGVCCTSDNITTIFNYMWYGCILYLMYLYV